MCAMYFPTLFEALAGVFIMKKKKKGLKNQIGPPDVALTFFLCSDLEVRVAYFCQSHKI